MLVPRLFQNVFRPRPSHFAFYY